MLAVALWKATGIVMRRFGASWLQQNTQADIRLRLIRHQLDLKLGWISRRSTGDLLAVTDSDASQAIWILGPLPYGTGVSLLLVGTVILIFSLDPWLGLLTLVSVVAIVALEIKGSWTAFSQFEKIQKLRSEVSDVAHESFDGALTVKSLGREDFETARFAERATTLRDQLVSIGRLFTFYRVIADSIPQVAMVFLLGGRSVSHTVRGPEPRRHGERRLPVLALGGPGPSGRLCDLGDGLEPGRMGAGRGCPQGRRSS